MLTFRQALVASRRLTDNQVMLTAREKLAKILAEDLHRLAKPKVDRAELAAACDVSRQAISNWIKTGLVKKEFLVQVAARTGKPLIRYLPASDRTPDSSYPIHKPGATLVAEQTRATFDSAPRAIAMNKIIASLADIELDHLELLANDIERDATTSRRLRERRAKPPDHET